MEKITFSRTEITEDKLMLMARTSELVKQLNSLTLVDFAKKQEIVKDLFGSVGSNPFVGDNFHCDFGKNIHVVAKDVEPRTLLAGNPAKVKKHI